MRNRHWRRAALLLLATAWFATTAAIETSAAQRFKWWQSDAAQTEIALTDDQVVQFEAIFQDLRPTLRELMQRLGREEDELSRLMHAMQAEEWEVALQIDKVEGARSALSKTRTLMLYRMHKILAPEQIDALHEMWERRQQRQSSSTHPSGQR